MAKMIQEMALSYGKEHQGTVDIEVFEAGANAVLEEIEKCYEKDDSLCAISHKIISKIQQLKGE